MDTSLCNCSVTVLKIAIASLLTTLVLFWPFRLVAGSQSEPACAYSSDNPPPALSPGGRQDADYQFCYISDYERTAGVYRRKIINGSSFKVRFDWPIAELGGSAPAHAQKPLSETTPMDSEPSVTKGFLFYDFRRTRTSAYSYYSHSYLSKLVRNLVSTLEGYVSDSSGTLVPIKINFSSRYSDGHYLYSLGIQSSIPAMVYVRGFSEFWKERNIEAYNEQFNALLKDGTLRRDSKFDEFVLMPDRTSLWNFSGEGTPLRRQSHIEIYSPGTRNADLYGVVVFYVPSQ